MSLFFSVLPIFGVIQTGAYRGGWHLDISYNGRIILLVVLLYVVPTECTDNTEAYRLKLFESTEWPTLREARIHRNECLRQTMGIILLVVLLYVVPTEYTDHTLSLQKKAIRLNNQGKTMIAKDSFVPLL